MQYAVSVFSCSNPKKVNKCLLLLQGKKKDECKSLLASLQTKCAFGSEKLQKRIDSTAYFSHRRSSHKEEVAVELLFSARANGLTASSLTHLDQNNADSSEATFVFI